MRNWDDYIENSKHWLSGKGYNQEIRKYNKLHPDRPRKEVPINDDEEYFIVANSRMCFVIKMTIFRKMTKTQRNKLYEIANL